MKTKTPVLSTLCLLSAAAPSMAAPGDFSPTAPARVSPGWLNDTLREKDPSMVHWDIGAQIRFRYEVRDQFAIPGAPGSLDFREHNADVDNAYLLHRIKPRVGYLNEWVNALIEGRSSGSTGDDRDPNPEADNPFDLHQAYVHLGNHKKFPVSLKVGRQELSYGDERLVGAFGWSNIGRVFDAAKLRYQNAWFGADLFSGRVIIPDDNNFNNPNDYDWFSGIYLNTLKVPKHLTELYFFSRNTSDQSPTVNGSGLPALLNGPPERDIYTVGLRFKSQPGLITNWDYMVEAMAQFGNFTDTALPLASRDLDHEAYALVINGGYTWADNTMKPRLGFEYAFGSGDSDPTDGKHETFENLFPTNHKFYGYMDFVSLQNIHNARLTASIKPVPRLNLTADFHMFWLASTDDNFYAVSGARRGGIGATPGTGYGINSGHGSYVGSEIDLVATYTISPHAQVEAGFGHFFRGDYIKDSLSAPTHGSKDANFVYLQLLLNL